MFCAYTIDNNNKKFRSFKSKENIHKKEDGPYRGSAIKASSVTLYIWRKEPEDKSGECLQDHWSSGFNIVHRLSVIKSTNQIQRFGRHSYKS